MRRLLIVDDNADLRFILREQLRRDGDGLELVGEAGDGREAVELAASAAPDVILLDVEMPQLDGIRALPALRSVAPGVRVVMHSARRARRDEALAAGADAWIDKGEPWTELRQALLAARSDLRAGGNGHRGHGDDLSGDGQRLTARARPGGSARRPS